MPKFDMSNEDHRQQHFITDLRDNAVADTNTELLSGNLEDLKTVIVDTLEKQSSLGDHSPPVIEETAIVRIYLMFDKLDRETVSLIDDYLYDQEFEVLRPIFEGQELDIRQVHQDNLKLCDGVFIYCNQASESWLNFKMSDVRKAPGYRNGKPLKAAAIYLCGDPNRFKKDFRTREVSAVIKQFGTFSKADLAPFIKTLRGDESVIK
jgi:hypothetical protein